MAEAQICSGYCNQQHFLVTPLVFLWINEQAKNFCQPRCKDTVWRRYQQTFGLRWTLQQFSPNYHSGCLALMHNVEEVIYSKAPCCTTLRSSTHNTLRYGGPSKCCGFWLRKRRCNASRLAEHLFGTQTGVAIACRGGFILVWKKSMKAGPVQFDKYYDVAANR
jgi:hypothetical protein